MKVSELIEKLQKMNPEAIVLHGDNERWNEGFGIIGTATEEQKGARVVLRDKPWDETRRGKQ